MSVFKHSRTGRWVAQVYDRDLGRKRQVGTFATKTEAKAAVRRAEAERPSSATTVAEWREQWLATPQWRESTRKHNAERTAKFAEKHGAKRLTAIDRTIARRWVEELPSSHHALSAMFTAAMYADNERGEPLLTLNPFSRLIRKRQARRDLQADWLTEGDIVRLEQAALQVHGPVVGETFAAMIRFAAETGVRPGELYVVEHADLHPDAGTLTVRRAADSKTRRIGPPKNGQAREIVLSRRAAEAAERAQQYTGTDRVFSTLTGKQWWQPSLAVHWGPVRRAAGRPTMDFYELRHYCATRLLEAGLPDDVVAVQLGHTDGGELVRKVYGHPSSRRALTAVRAALDGEAA